METQQFGIEQESLSRYVKMSILLHIGIFCAFGIQAVFFMDAPIQFENAIRVDMVGLPDKVAELPPAPEAAKVPEPEVKATPTPDTMPPAEKVKMPPKAKEPEAINLEKTKSKQKSAMEKLKQMEALEAIEKDIEKDKLKAAEAAKVKFKGNVLAPGTALTGVNKLQADQYIGTVHQHMIDHWTLPEYMKNRNLRTDVLVRFDENGNILEKEIVKASGNPSFDELVMSAVQKSSPVPAPPSKFAKISSVQGFLFRFSHN